MADNGAELVANALAAARAQDVHGALHAARQALAAAHDPAAVLTALAVGLLRAEHEDLVAILAAEAEAAGMPVALTALLQGKAALSADDADTALAQLERACAVPEPAWEARLLRVQALRRSGAREEARSALSTLVPLAPRPWEAQVLVAEWTRADGLPAEEALRAAIALATVEVQGRLRERLAHWEGR